MINRVLLAIAVVGSIVIGAVTAWGLTPGQNTVVVLPVPAGALSITSPINGATIAGTITITGVAGEDWVNVAGYDAGNSAKVAQDVAPSGRAFKLSLPTATLSNGTHNLFIQAFSLPPGTLGGTSASVNLTVVVNNGGGGPGGNAVAANDFLNSLGVNTNNCAFLQSTFEPWCTGAVEYLGVRILRGLEPEFVSGGGGGIPLSQFISFAQTTGTKWLAGLGSSTFGPNISVPLVISYADAAMAAGVLVAVDGPNEPNGWPVTYNGTPYGGCPPPTCTTNSGAGNWLGVAQELNELYKAVHNDGNLAGIPVYGTEYMYAELYNSGVQCAVLNSSCPGASVVTQMPANTVFYDYANEHNYLIESGGTITPVDNQAWYMADPTNSSQAFIPTTYLYSDYGVTGDLGFLGYTNAQLTTLPKVTTESGWYMTAGDGSTIGAKMLLNLYLSQYKRGWSATYIYEIGDCTYNTDAWGLFNCGPSTSTYSPKQAAINIHNLTTILADNVEFTTGSLSYAVLSEPPTVHDLLLQKSGGAFELVVWDEQCPSSSSIGPLNSGHCTQPVPTQNVTVTLGGTHTTVNTYDPTQGTAPVAPCAPCTGANTSSVVLPLTDHPYIIEIIG